MTKPTLQPERITAPDIPRPVAPEIIEIRSVTLKEALQLVRALADRTEPREQK
jgi:hypothetical protein